METPSRADRATIDGVWWLLPTVLPALVALVVPLGTIDLAYHLRLGASIVADGSIPSVDSFTFSVPGRAWVDQQWLAQVVLERAYWWAGWSGPAVLGAALIGAAGAITAATCRARGGSVRGSAALALVGFVVAAPMLAVRPQLFAVPLFAAALWATWTRARSPHRLWLLPLIALALANLHGSFPLVVVMALLAAAEDLVSRRPSRRSSLIVAGATVVATFISPFGVSGWRYVADITRNPVIREQISEWAPLSLTRAPGVLVALSVALVAVIAIVRRDRIRPVDMVWLTVFLAPAVASQRAVVWWALTFPVVVAAWIGGAEPSDHARPSRRVPIVVGAVLLILALPWWRGGPTLDDAPPGVTQVVAALPEGRRVFVQQPWGSWFEHATPEHATYVDSRIELFPEDVWDRYDTIAAGGDGAVEALEGTGADAVAGELGWPLVERLRDEPGWRVVYDGPDGVVVLRR